MLEDTGELALMTSPPAFMDLELRHNWGQDVIFSLSETLFP